ncbi:hypothetical protein HU200_063588 [Digitaria exilis]|uniref:RNase H type-1 domain-containing protein n=1 Tax=Digitaria exilis TaxID=1010633 RepID=A0A835A550_9POAL|nr:hypothetical protein HU200_063588 [Digitaria exilis]
MMQIQLESDSMVLVKALKSDEYDHSLGGVMFRKAKFLLFTQFAFVQVGYVYVPRYCISCAHELARMGMSWDPDETGIWVDPLPEFVKILMVRDLP